MKKGWKTKSEGGKAVRSRKTGKPIHYQEGGVDKSSLPSELDKVRLELPDRVSKVRELELLLRKKFDIDELKDWQDKAPRRYYHGTSRDDADIFEGGLKSGMSPSHLSIDASRHLPFVYLTKQEAFADSFGTNVYQVDIKNKNHLYPDPEFTGDLNENDYSMVMYAGDIPTSHVRDVKKIGRGGGIEAPMHISQSKFAVTKSGLTKLEIPIGVQTKLVTNIWGGSTVSYYYGLDFENSVGSYVFESEKLVFPRNYDGKVQTAEDLDPFVELVVAKMETPEFKADLEDALYKAQSRNLDVTDIEPIPQGVIRDQIRAYLAWWRQEDRF